MLVIWIMIYIPFNQKKQYRLLASVIRRTWYRRLCLRRDDLQKSDQKGYLQKAYAFRLCYD